MTPWTQERGPPTSDALDPSLGLSGPGQPPAWENPGLLPGAAALAGQSGGGDSRNLPRDRRRVTRQHPPIYGQRFRCVSRESPGARGWAGPHLRTACIAPGIRPQVLGGWTAYPPWTFLLLGSGNTRRDCEILGQSWRGDTHTEASHKQHWGGDIPILSSLRPPGLEKKTTEINKEPVFFLLK